MEIAIRIGGEGPYGIAEHGADIAAIADSIPGRVIVVGHSMGAYVALAAAELTGMIDTSATP